MADGLRVLLVLCAWFTLSAIVSVSTFCALVAGGMDPPTSERFAQAFGVAVFFGLFTWDFIV